MDETELLQFRTLYDSQMIAVRDYIFRHDHREERFRGLTSTAKFNQPLRGTI